MRWLRGRVGTDRDGLYLYFSAPHCAVRRRESRLVWWWMNGEAEGKARGDSAKLLARNSLHNNARHTHSRGFLPNSKSHATQTRQSTCHTPPPRLQLAPVWFYSNNSVFSETPAKHYTAALLSALSCIFHQRSSPVLLLVCRHFFSLFFPAQTTCYMWR